MTPRERLVVVGDRFADFAAQARVVTVAELARAVAAGEAAGALVAEGQGLHDEQRVWLRANAALEVEPLGACADAALVHKQHARNVMIGAPRRLGERVFELELVLDERGEMLHDHLTGQHIQGMALIEAARQACIAVTETFYTGGSPQSYQFVLESVAARFASFVFPLPVTIGLELTEVSIDHKLRLAFRAAVSFRQSGRDAVTVEVAYQMYDRRLIRKQEDLMAQRAVAGATVAEAVR